jgi:hypothetical protein
MVRVPLPIAQNTYKCAKCSLFFFLLFKTLFDALFVIKYIKYPHNTRKRLKTAKKGQ